MNKQPIIIVAGEPNSVFLEIFFKSIKSNKFKHPLIIIASRKLLISQMNKLGYIFKINSINKNLKNISELNNKNINLINVDYKFNACFQNITIKSKSYIEKCFKIALEILKKINLQNLLTDQFLKGIF